VALTEGFIVRDSGERKQFDSGMVRDTTEGKIRWDLTADGPMLRRWAEHMTKGAQKYDARNWMLAAGTEEHDRFRESAFRHFMAWYLGERDEDHGAAVFFNINGAEYVAEQLPKEPALEECGQATWCNTCGKMVDAPWRGCPDCPTDGGW
jgi:hypothetical protein